PASSESIIPKLVARTISWGRSPGTRIPSDPGRAPSARAGPAPTRTVEGTTASASATARPPAGDRAPGVDRTPGDPGRRRPAAAPIFVRGEDPPATMRAGRGPSPC